MAKLPALQFYPGDWRKDLGVQSLDFHDRGVWFEMLMLMHDSERRGVLVLNGAAMTPEMIARAIGLDNQILTSTLSTLLSSGVASRESETGAIYCRRMVRDEYIRKVRTESGRKGGNPALLNQNGNGFAYPNSNQPPKQKPTPSSSVSDSSTKQKTEQPFELPPWMDSEVWDTYLEVRASKKAAKTPRAWRAVLKQLDAFRLKGHDPNSILETSIRSNWIDVYEPKTGGNINGRIYESPNAALHRKLSEELDKETAANPV